MSVREFDKLFGLESTIEKEKEKFVNRIEVGLFNWLKQTKPPNQYYELFTETCYVLGENAQKHIDYYRINPLYAKEYRSYPHPNLTIITNSEYTHTLRVIVAIYQCSTNVPLVINRVSKIVNDSLQKSALNIGIKWNNGIFYPTGEPILDEELIDYSLSVLNDFPNEKKDLQIALSNYQAGQVYGVVENCYNLIEGVSQKLLNNKKSLENNKIELLNLFPNRDHWGTILANYIKYAHDYRRHSGENRHNLKPAEIEGFLYLTCIMVRLLIRSINENG